MSDPLFFLQKKKNDLNSNRYQKASTPKGRFSFQIPPVSSVTKSPHWIASAF